MTSLKYSPTGPSWDTVCILKDSSFSGSLWSSFLIANALAIILLFFILFGSLSLRPMILAKEHNADWWGRKDKDEIWCVNFSGNKIPDPPIAKNYDLMVWNPTAAMWLWIRYWNHQSSSVMKKIFSYSAQKTDISHTVITTDHYTCNDDLNTMRTEKKNAKASF